MDERVVWLWPEGRQGKHLRGWTPDHTERFADLASGDPSLAARFDPCSLVEGSEARALEAVLPAPLALWLAARLRQTPRLFLRLSTDLPAAWQRFPYEWLTLDGQPLHDRLRVWRHVPRTAEPVPPARTAPVALLDLWPGAAAVQPLAGLAVSPVDAHRYDGRRWVEALLRTRDPRAFSALCLVVHGSERAGVLPFRLPDDTLWELPPTPPLPPLVILLACGGGDGNLLDYAATLLNRGANAVLAALGPLDARDITAVLPRLLQGWLRGERIGAALDAAQAAVAWQGRGRLCLLGAGDLRMGDAPALADRATDPLALLARAGDNAALRELLPRLTLQAFLTAGEPSPATRGLREQLAIAELGAPADNLRLLHRLHPLTEALPILSQLWVLPLMAHLAEQHDHESLNRYRRRLEELARTHPEFAGLYAGWAKAEYRRGHYARAAAATMDGLRCATGTDEISIRLLGSLILVLLDLNLPEAGQVLFDLRERRLDRLGGEFAAREQFKGLDSQGRLALRRGEYRAALACFRRKRAEAPEHGEIGGRELAWLLYAAALIGPVDGDARYAEDCRTMLADHPEPGNGNDDVLYLLRALAAWAWRRQDAAARAVLASWLPELESRLDRRQDTGPIGFTLSYLHLDRQPWGGPPALPGWETIRVGLKADRYFFELAVFGRLLERPREEIEGWLNRYQQERRTVMDTLAPENLPAWLRPELPETRPEDLDDRESRERELLLAAGPPDWNALVAAHLLPW